MQAGEKFILQVDLNFSPWMNFCVGSIGRNCEAFPLNWTFHFIRSPKQKQWKIFPPPISEHVLAYTIYAACIYSDVKSGCFKFLLISLNFLSEFFFSFQKYDHRRDRTSSAQIWKDIVQLYNLAFPDIALSTETKMLTNSISNHSTARIAQVFSSLFLYTLPFTKVHSKL